MKEQNNGSLKQRIIANNSLSTKLTPAISNYSESEKEYDQSHLNWRDDGDELTDPCMNDYLKGYNINPYEFQQWASSSKHKKKYASMMKKGSGEVFVMQFSPDFLADRILTLWNGVDGPLQNFFEAFTLRYNNILKQQIADRLAKQGYIVYPQLIDDKPRYANRLEKLMKKVAKSKDVDSIMVFATNISNSPNLHLFAGELADLREAGQPVSLNEAHGILKYYQNCFPEDYALKLISGLMNSQTRQYVEYDKFKDHDWNFSDESLKKIEDYMSGSHPSYIRDGGGEGWNFTTDMRNFDGTSPGRYELTTNKFANKRLLKKKYRRADKRKSKKKR